MQSFQHNKICLIYNGEVHLHVELIRFTKDNFSINKVVDKVHKANYSGFFPQESATPTMSKIETNLIPETVNVNHKR